MLPEGALQGEGRRGAPNSRDGGGAAYFGTQAFDIARRRGTSARRSVEQFRRLASRRNPPYQPRPAMSSFSGMSEISMPTMASPRSRETRAMVSGSS